MVQRNSNIYTVLRSLKKPTVLDKIIDSVPKPKGAVPNFGLPKWRSLPLETKIPLIPGPYNFTRKKIGQKLYRPSRGAEFDLTDPNNYEFDFKYDPLHDHHLAHFFSNKNTIRQLIDLGFVTENYDATCSVKEYNMYRKYLRKLHGDSVKRELKRRERIEAEQRALDFAFAEAQREASKLMNTEKTMNVRDRMRNEVEQRDAEKRQRQILKLEHTEERLKLLELKKYEKHEQMILRGKLRDEHAKLKQRLVAERERQRIVGVLLKWLKKEKDRKRFQKQECTKRREDKFQAIAKKWAEREDYQQLQLTRENFVLEYAAEEAKRNIAKYMKKIENERRKIERNIKNNSKFWKCYKMRRAMNTNKCCNIKKIDKNISNKLKSYESSLFDDKGEFYNDECEMTEKCKCNVDNDYCMDLRQLLF